MKVKDYKEQIDSYLDYGNTIWFINNKTKEIIVSLWNKTEWYKEVFDILDDCNISHQSSHPLCNDINLYIEAESQKHDITRLQYMFGKRAYRNNNKDKGEF